MSDPYWSDVVLLALHENGADGSATFIDLSNSGHVLTTQGNAQWDTAQALPGLTSSMLCDGTGDGVLVPSHADFAFGLGDYTVEFFIIFNALVAGSFQNLISTRTGSGDTPAWLIYCTEEFGRLTFNINGGVRIQTANGVVTTGIPYHIALARKDGVTRLFVHGVQDVTTYIDVNDYPQRAIDIGRAEYTATDGVDGWVFAVRITKGIARYEANFTPPTLPYEMAPGVDIRALVKYLDTRGTGGSGMQRLVFDVTFYGDDVSAEIAGQKQLQINVDMANVFTIAELRAAIVANVQARAIEFGLAIEAANIITPDWAVV